MDNTDGSGSSKPTKPLSEGERYLKGHEGYKRWYGDGSVKHNKEPRDSADEKDENKLASTDRYYKGHEGYKKYYGSPGSPVKKNEDEK